MLMSKLKEYDNESEAGWQVVMLLKNLDQSKRCQVLKQNKTENDSLKHILRL